jgi:hypothetical protein
MLIGPERGYTRVSRKTFFHFASEIANGWSCDVKTSQNFSTWVTRRASSSVSSTRNL